MKKITDKKYEVLVVHYMPFDPKYGLGKTKEEIEEMGGVFVTEIPEPERIGGKYPIRYWDPIKQEIFYEYEENIPGSKEEIQEERLTKLENDITILQNNSIEQKYNELMKGVK
ncbi:hypothetical protein CLOSPO_01918 [Clostridium sporogenes ATCC 15579]|nr:hypothetical protein CLOSPO_01918 [Clostridium sporogenes ATCC 15579]